VMRLRGVTTSPRSSSRQCPSHAEIRAQLEHFTDPRSSLWPAATSRSQGSSSKSGSYFNPRSTVEVLRPQPTSQTPSVQACFNPRSTVKVLRQSIYKWLECKRCQPRLRAVRTFAHAGNAIRQHKYFKELFFRHL